MNQNRLCEACRALATDLVTLYALFCDTTDGFVRNAEVVLHGQKRLRRTRPTGWNPGRENRVHYGPPLADRGDGWADVVVVGSDSVSEYIEKNKLGGRNHVLAAHQFLVSIYTSWEHKHRREVSEALGLPDTADLKVPVFGDLRVLRHDILHHHGVVRTETIARLKVLSRFCESKAELTLDEHNVFDLVQEVLAAADKLVIDTGGEDPRWREGRNYGQSRASP